MKKIAIIFNEPPHGTAKGREALDAAFALSMINDVSIFFMNKGIFHLLPNQKPELILARDYIATLSMLELYDIDKIYVCQEDLKLFNLQDEKFNIEVKIADKIIIKKLLDQQDAILQF